MGSSRPAGRFPYRELQRPSPACPTSPQRCIGSALYDNNVQRFCTNRQPNGLYDYTTGYDIYSRYNKRIIPSSYKWVNKPPASDLGGGTGWPSDITFLTDYMDIPVQTHGKVSSCISSGSNNGVGNPNYFITVSCNGRYNELVVTKYDFESAYSDGYPNFDKVNDLKQLKNKN